MRCRGCGVEIVGEWSACPLCQGTLDGAPVASPHPDVPLRYDVRRLLMWLAGVSLLLVVGSLVAVQFFRGPISGFRLVWFALVSVWLVVLTVVRKRRNVAKMIVYTVTVGSLLTLYADHLRGWEGWSVDWVIPILCSSAIVAVFVAVRIARMEPADFIIYLWSTVVMGMLPAIPLALGWTGYDLPSWISIILAGVALLFVCTLHSGATGAELRKRLSI